jgi:hypothetical protein
MLILFAQLGRRPMAKKTKKRNPKIILRLPDLEQSKTAVLNSLSSLSSDVPTITLFGTSSNGTAQNPARLSTEPW